MAKLYAKRLAREERKVRVIYISSYIPRQCGLATYTKDLTTAINLLNPQCLSEITAINDCGNHYDYPWEVKFRIDQDDLGSYYKTADYINQSSAEVVNLQHEFGLFGGKIEEYSGEYVLALAKKIKKPLITTFHTVLSRPSSEQRKVVKELTKISKAVVVMIEEAVRRLVKLYGVERKKIVLIYHGVPDIPYGPQDHYKNLLGFSGKDVLCTFGLINRGKGIEYALESLPDIVKEHPNVLYIILGKTHPVVCKKEGETYRKELETLVSKLKLQKNVLFDNRYLSLDELVNYLRATDIFISPYLNPQQLTSGVLAYSVGAGRVCISTPYLYAQNVLAENRGILVPFKDSLIITKEVNYLLSHPEKRIEIERNAYAYGRQMIWTNVALKHLDLFCLIAKEASENEKKIKRNLKKTAKVKSS